jgi:hypothetical protein
MKFCGFLGVQFILPSFFSSEIHTVRALCAEIGVPTPNAHKLKVCSAAAPLSAHLQEVRGLFLLQSLQPSASPLSTAFRKGEAPSLCNRCNLLQAPRLSNAAQHKQDDSVSKARTSPTSSSQSPLQIACLISSPSFSIIEASWCNRKVSLHARKCILEVVHKGVGCEYRFCLVEFS